MKNNLSNEQRVKMAQATSVGVATFGHFAQKGKVKLTKEALQKEADILTTTIDRDIYKRAAIKPVAPTRRGPGRSNS